ncbi:metallophosphoesterase, partial [bacterium]|nr:metallophosphoesterase [bacterium]
MKNKFLKIFLTIFAFALTTFSANAFSFRNMTLDFIDITDTHISQRADTSYKALSSSVALLEDAVSQINQIKGLDFVLFTGDLVDEGSYTNYDLFFNAISRLKYPHLCTFGNHDFYGSMTEHEVLTTVKGYNKNYTFDKPYWAISPKTDYRIIGLDSNSDLKGVNTSNGKLSDEQLAFLDKELEENQDKIVVIAMHHASVEPFVSEEHSLLNAKEFNEILIKYKNPIVVLSGHYHTSKIRRIGNIIYVSTSALVTYPMAFRHIKIVNFKDRVEYKFELLTTGLKEVREQNRQNLISYSTLEGFESDRNLEFTYYKKHPKSVLYKRKRIEEIEKTAKSPKREIKKFEKQEQEKVQKEEKE